MGIGSDAYPSYLSHPILCNSWRIPMNINTALNKGVLPGRNLRRKEKNFAYISLAPILLLFVVFSVIPIFWGTLLMFFNYNPIDEHSPFVGMANFQRLLENETFHKAFFNTFKFVFIAIPANIIITLMIAIGINKIRSMFWKNTFRTMFFLPAIAPLAGTAVVWSTMFNNQNGLFNMLLEQAGLESINWLTDPATAMLSVIIMTLWADIGYNIVIFMAGLDSIPNMFYEAAELDGANKWQLFWHITLPLLSRTSLFIFVMTSISYFQMFPQFQILTGGGPQNKTRVLSLEIFDNAFTYMNMGYASAMAFVLLIIILIITVVQIRLGRSKWEY